MSDLEAIYQSKLNKYRKQGIEPDDKLKQILFDEASNELMTSEKTAYMLLLMKLISYTTKTLLVTVSKTNKQRIR